MRRLSLLLGLVLLASLIPVATQAQDKVEIFGGYSYMRVDNSPSFNTNGWELSGDYKFYDWLGAAADVDGHSGTVGGASTTIHTFLFGPQVTWPHPGKVTPFAHVLVGGGHVNVAGVTDSSFGLAVGAGIDYRLEHGIYWRVVQGDLLHTHLFGVGQNNGRLSTGIVFKF